LVRRQDAIDEADLQRFLGADELWTAIAAIPLNLTLSQKERKPRLALPLEEGGSGR
jgi:hypothetical protein